MLLTIIARVGVEAAHNKLIGMRSAGAKGLPIVVPPNLNAQARMHACLRLEAALNLRAGRACVLSS